MDITLNAEADDALGEEGDQEAPVRTKTKDDAGEIQVTFFHAVGDLPERNLFLTQSMIP